MVTDPFLLLPSILHEVRRAEQIHPEWPDDIIYAAAIVSEESGELIRAAIRFKYEEGATKEEIRKEAIQTAATCIRLLKNL
jgi:hypothetical protein